MNLMFHLDNGLMYIYWMKEQWVGFSTSKNPRKFFVTPKYLLQDGG